MQVSPINTVKVLDHGFVSLHNIAGPTRRPECEFDANDVDPANVARMSFNQMDSGRTEAQDLKLCEYLMKNWHTQPFEQIEVWLEMKLPIFVARQFVRHRSAANASGEFASMNEVSGRYVTLPREWYIPETVGGKPVGGAKQAQSDTLDAVTQEQFRVALDRHCNRGYVAYEGAIRDGVAPEHARMFLSLNHYTHWMWKQDLHNLFHFLSLRDHSHAQTEAQKYAQAIDSLVRRVLPNCFALYDKYRRQEAL